MLKKLIRFLTIPSELSALKNEIESIKILNGKLFSQINQNKVNEIIENIHLSEFKVFSQFGDDGIIQFLVDYLKIENKKFVEFGVEKYTESNTRYLLVNNNWSGLIFDSSMENMDYVRNDQIYWRFDLKAVPAFITKDNINGLIKENGFEGDIGLLHIDIDGNEYWVWKAIDIIKPTIVIMEYNSVFGCEKAWTIPYEEKFNHKRFHYSGLYFGVSLLSLCDLADEKGYIFIGCNSSGNNAYFVKKEKKGELKSLNAKEGYVLSKFREGRDINGRLTYASGQRRLDQIKGMQVFNTRSKKIEII